ncbi:MAG: choice-of-anchor B family protein [Bacteroidia bacterium]
MKKLLSFLCGFIFCISSIAQNTNVVLRSQFPYAGLQCANICGYVDTTGKEYALVGVQTGMSIVDVSDPDNPFQVIQLPWGPGVNQLWKEIKVYKKHAYVVSEAGGGIQIADLSFLPAANVPYSYWRPAILTDTLNTVHALHIDTTLGNLYLYGSNIGIKGAIAASLANPASPVYLGIFNQQYVHDGYVDNDTLYAAEIYLGLMDIIDFTNKSNPVSIATVATPGAFTHNTWLSPDKKTVFTTDEVSGSFLTSYDISNFGNITELDRIQSNPGSGSIVHNTHITPDNYAVTSWYKDGFTIVDVSRPHNMIQVGNYDTYPTGAGNGFHGDWGVYPFLPSGTIVVSNIEAGLFVLTPTYVRGCYLEGNTKDSITGNNLNGVSVQILSLANTTTLSAGTGDYATGTVSAGTYSIQFSRTGYQTRIINNVTLSNGLLSILNVKLLPNGAGIGSLANDRNFITVNGNPFYGQARINYYSQSGSKQNSLLVFDNIGRIVFEKTMEAASGEIMFGENLKAGVYYVSLNNCKPVKLIKSE